VSDDTVSPAAPMRIAIDVMGGDKGAKIVTQGALQAARESRAHYLLVGDPNVIKPELAASGLRNVEIISATQVIEMTDQPTVAYKKKPDASVVVGAKLVKDKRADALVTIGNTGAAMAVSLLTWGRIKGIDRPAIATPLPSLKGTVVLLDAGATPDCDPNNLYEFALMGSIYTEKVLGVAKPAVGLLSNGEESSKGNELVKRAHALFTQQQEERPFHFFGNVEGGDVYRGAVDVVVCDGFTGNVFLKTSEGVAEMILRSLRDSLAEKKLLAPFVLPLKPTLHNLRKKIDYAERGGAPLLGLNGICIIGHGKSDAYAVQNACRAAERAVASDIVSIIRDRVCEAPAPPPPPI
jgi:phosphate acyltransferase